MFGALLGRRPPRDTGSAPAPSGGRVRPAPRAPEPGPESTAEPTEVLPPPRPAKPRTATRPGSVKPKGQGSGPRSKSRQR
jgi:hypothetical protein